MSGGAWEMTAGYLTNGNENLSYGLIASGIPKLVVKTTMDATAYQLLSSKYATIYPHDLSNDTRISNYTTYKNANYGYGDAILETSPYGEGYTSWFGDRSDFPKSTAGFFGRGVSYLKTTGAGVFAFTSFSGNGELTGSFRAVLIAI